MNINERVRVLRNHLNITQADFGNKISVTQNHLSGIEVGRREVTERMIKLICNEFNVFEKWLRTGEGKMFLEKTLDEELTGNERTLNILKEISKLEDHESELILQLLKIINRDK